jgi:hypothetical protein
MFSLFGTADQSAARIVFMLDGEVRLECQVVAVGQRPRAAESIFLTFSPDCATGTSNDLASTSFISTAAQPWVADRHY